ncbi:Uncharacterised protein [Bacillus freudenreichii]|nr:Uncharacterised protein [Bacillus freudenreichii]
MGNPVNQLAFKVGFWSSVLFALTGIGYAIGMVALLVAFPIPEWRGISDTVAGFSSSYINYYSLCQTMAFISAPLFVVMVCCVHEYASPEKKFLTRISVCFALMFAAFSSMNYFVQFTAVRLSILNGQLEGLEQFVQWNPTSAFYSINLLGWTLFLGLASFFIAPVFIKEKRGRLIMRLFILNGIVCVLGTVAAVFEIMIYLAIFPLLMTGFITAASVMVGLIFRKNAGRPLKKGSQVPI